MGQGESKTDVFLKSVKLNAPVDPQVANKIWDEFDVNKNGKLDKPEAAKFVTAWCKANNVDDVDGTAAEFFKHFDVNHDGSISKDEIMGKVAGGYGQEEKVAAGGKKGAALGARRPFVGKWVSREYVKDWLAYLRALPVRQWVPPIKDFALMVESDPMLRVNADAQFLNAPPDPLGQPGVQNFYEFCTLVNQIMFTAPLAYQSKGPPPGPAGLIGFPINALLDYPMATPAGLSFWGNQLVNQMFKKVLVYWSKFLVTENSRYVLLEGQVAPPAIPWLSPTAQQEMVAVATSALPNNVNPTPQQFDLIFECNPSDPSGYYGFTSWDSFFTRLFRAGVRPVEAPGDPNIIVNACESAPFRVSPNVQLSDQFYLKGQAYSLEDMLGWDELTPQFAGGTVYQAFLSALSYHRWNSPVAGTIVKQYVINGTYYLETVSQAEPDPDPSAPNNSQAFLASVATRSLIFIQADNPAIGLMCVIAIGMAEVSSCDVTVQAGQHVNKGDQLGMFHFGGSTHCLVFRPQTRLSFELYGIQPGEDASTNIRMGAKIATVLQ